MDEEKIKPTMKKPIFLLPFFAIISCYAGQINIVHLGTAADAKITVSCQGKSQPFTLKQGEDSGTFTLPDRSATVRLEQEKDTSIDVDTRKSGKILILLADGEAPRWHSIESKPQQGKNSVRLINTTGKPLTATIAGEEVKVEPGAEHASIAIATATIAVKMSGGKKSSIKPEEPGAYLAIAYQSADKTAIRFVADR